MTAHPLQSFVNQLCAHTSLTDGEKQTLLDLPASGRRVPAEQTVVEREDVVEYSCVVLSGLLARTSHTMEGARQITSFYVCGDMPDLDTLMRPRAMFGLQAVCLSEIVSIPHTALREAVTKHARIGEAFSRKLVRERDIASEWIVNLGRRNARERIAHLFCEIAVKLGADQEAYTMFPFPATQTTVADATGLSPVHVNRSIQSLRQDGLLQFEHGTAEIPHWGALASLAGFDKAYLQADKPLEFVSC